MYRQSAFARPRTVLLALLLALVLLCGCTSMATRTSGSFSESLSRAVLQQNDPETVRQGAPALLLMLDGLISSDPDNQALLLSGSRLYGAYASAFVEDEQRQRRLADKSYNYARRAICLTHEAFCVVIDKPLATFREQLE